MSFEEQQLHREFILENQLKEYAARGLYPMHMPGHKRQPVGEQFGKILAAADVVTNEAGGMGSSKTGAATELPYGWDVTEVPGTDDLHDAEGILREAMDRTARLYGAARTWYLVNGSTCGLLAGIRAIAPYGSEVIVARNCHKAVYHAIELQNLTVHWVWPAVDETFGIYESVRPDTVAALLGQHPETAAVIITSPTYEGIVSDIHAIAEICHANHIPLLVDEAHGAHLGFHKMFPDSAIHLGADIVVQSPHKTLPSLTQTAWMHLSQNALISASAIEMQLDVFETSSPSYPLMASLDGCTGILAAHGVAMFDAYADGLTNILAPACGRLEHLQVYGYTYRSNVGHDPSKILISGRKCGITGAQLADLLREEYQIETEMHLGWSVLAMTSVCDTRQGLERLANAIVDIDNRAQSNVDDLHSNAYNIRTETVETIGEAARQLFEIVTAENAVGCVAAEYVYCYPPGIPIVVPGERITKDIIRQLDQWQRYGAAVHHSATKDGYCVIR